METSTLARIVHEANRALCEAHGDNSQKTWENAEEWQRNACIDVVGRLISMPCITAESTHFFWHKSLLEKGWKHGPSKCSEVKTHPCLVPWDDLPGLEKSKDILVAAIIRALNG